MAFIGAGQFCVQFCSDLGHVVGVVATRKYGVLYYRVHCWTALPPASHFIAWNPLIVQRNSIRTGLY